MRTIGLLLISLVLFSCSGQAQSGDSKSKLLAPVEFQEALQQTDDYYLIDVRTPREYQAGTIEGAENLNISDGTFEQAIEALDKEKPVYVFCAVGGRSGRAAKILKQKGFKEIIDLKGGFNSWKRTQPSMK